VTLELARINNALEHLSFRIEKIEADITTLQKDVKEISEY
jgi:uncharacterized protein (UPF0335 family)